MGFSVADLDEDFDPTSYDEAMERTFDNDYYDMEEEGGDEEEGGEDGKPVFSDDDGEWLKKCLFCCYSTFLFLLSQRSMVAGTTGRWQKNHTVKIQSSM